jgi:putative ABC transport system permease protein
VINRRAFGWSIEVTVGPGVLLEAVGLAVLAAVAAGVYPAWRMAQTPPAPALREE